MKLKHILNFINFVKNNTHIILAVIFLFFIIFFIKQCSTIDNLRSNQIINEQNLLALSDSIKSERMRNNELQFSISGFISSENELKNLNRQLWNRVRQQEGQVLFLSRSIIQLRQDSTQLNNALIEKSKIIEEFEQISNNLYAANWVLPFKYDSTNFDIFSGRTYVSILNNDSIQLRHIDTKLTNRLTQIDLTWGQEIIDNKLRVFIRSAYPGFTVRSLEGVFIDPNHSPYIRQLIQRRHWFSGFGLGLSVTGGYNIINGNFGIVVGPSIHYTIYNW